MDLILIVALPFIGSLCAGWLRHNARNAEAWLAGFVCLATLVLTARLYPQIAAGEVLRLRLAWLPQYGLDLYLRLDGYAWLFAMLITFIGTLIVLYARYYMSPADPVPRFFSFLLAFMGAMLGVVLSGNLIQLVMFWELTSLTSFTLIGYWYHRADARRGARMALIVTATGGVCLLAGVILVGRVVGSYDLDPVLAAGARLQADPWYPAIMGLVVLGALTKSAQFPFHFWLPHAMAAPTPVSAYLHSATMVKAGVFLLARLWPVLAGTDAWFWIVGGAGLCSLVLGASAAIFQRDMKGVLAYSTISHLGLITLLLGMNSRLALVAAVFHIMNHATFKATLFMATGVVDHETGTRDLSRLGGLYRNMPITATLAMVAAAAMAGVPLLNGFLSKEMFFAETIFAGQSLPVRLGLPLAATIAGMFSVAYSLRFIHQVFFGPLAQGLRRRPQEPTRWMLLPSMLLVLVCMLVGIFPEQTLGPFLRLAAQAILGEAAPHFDLAVWHGLTMPLVMSLLALGGGFSIYLGLYLRDRVNSRQSLLPARIDGRRLFDIQLMALFRLARALMRRASSPRLQMQVLAIVCVAATCALLPLRELHPDWSGATFTAPDPAFALLWLVGAACAVGTALWAEYHRLAALIMAGGAGLVTCLTFVWFSAPDLALTQLAVEVVTVVLILLGLRWLPRRLEQQDQARKARLRTRARRARDTVIALMVGSGMAGLSLALLTRPPPGGISTFFVGNALAQAGGRNIVNVILVDFRAFDTLGEITVVAIVALTVYALLRRFRPAAESIRLPRAQREEIARHGAVTPDPMALLPTGDMRLPAVLVRLLLPMAALVSVYFLLRGHDAPGGGFVGGLVLAISVILQYMVGGTLWVESRSRIHPPYWIALGLLVAVLSGAGAWLAAQPFLTALGMAAELPLIGTVPVSSVLLFDIGVYMLVIGSTVLMLIAVAHQSVRSGQRRPAAQDRGGR